MTPEQIKKAEEIARKDAEALGIVLLTRFRDKRGVGTIDGRKLEYDASTAKFRIGGRAVSLLTIRMFLRRIDETMAKRLVRITSQLENNEISFAAWQREFERTISSIHILAGSLVLGSIVAAANHRGIQTRIDEQIAFADGFADDMRKSVIKRGRFSALDTTGNAYGLPHHHFTGQSEARTVNSIPKVRFSGMSAAQIRARAKSYLQAAHITFSNVELTVRKALGVDREARNVLTPAEHCSDSRAHIDRWGVPQPARPGCPEITRKGWMLIDEMTPIGERTCTRWCKCWIEYR